MIIALTLLCSILTVLLGRWMFGRWFNHVGLYGAIWGGSLTLFHVDLIHYFPLEIEAWAVIIAGWVAFVLGSAVVLSARSSLRRGNVATIGRGTFISTNEHSLLLRTLWIVNGIVIVVGLHELYVVSKLVGSLSNVFALGNFLYSVRVHEGLPGVIPYLDSLTLTACLLAGLYTSIVGTPRLVAIIPLVGLIMISIANMSRALIIVGAILFLSGYFSNKRRLFESTKAKATSKFKRVLTVGLIVVALVSGMEVVRGNRGMTERFAGATTTLSRLSVGAGSFLTPSIIMYVTVQHGVLNQYLKKGTEDPPIGNYSLAPLWRVLSKLGFDTYVAQHQPFYNVPLSANTGSYLRELHADYGVAGVAIAPFFIGFFASFFWLRYERTQSLFDLVILGHVYVVVGMSLFALAIQMGNWLASFIFGLMISLAYSRGLSTRRPWVVVA